MSCQHMCRSAQHISPTIVQPQQEAAVCVLAAAFDSPQAPATRRATRRVSLPHAVGLPARTRKHSSSRALPRPHRQLGSDPNFPSSS
eukprot:2035625-Rhodomonas_salina.3